MPRRVAAELKFKSWNYEQFRSLYLYKVPPDLPDYAASNVPVGIRLDPLTTMNKEQAAIKVPVGIQPLTHSPY